MSNFAYMVAQFNKNLGKDQRQTFDGLNNNEITALVTVNGRMLEPLELAFPGLQSYHRVDTDAFDKQIGGVILQKQLYSTDRPIGIGQVCAIIPRVHTKQPLKIDLVGYGPY